MATSGLTIVRKRNPKRLVIRVDATMQSYLRKIRTQCGNWHTHELFRHILHYAIKRTHLEFLDARRIGALTDSPIIGRITPKGECKLAFYLPDYAVHNPLDDLADSGIVVFEDGLAEE